MKTRMIAGGAKAVAKGLRIVLGAAGAMIALAVLAVLAMEFAEALVVVAGIGIAVAFFGAADSAGLLDRQEEEQEEPFNPEPPPYYNACGRVVPFSERDLARY
ncbi:MAG: hypothetical protein OXE48_10965 [Gammaproteobacteria bacterium]|nr:hypothetical protein [Gammaproteobacteria bacterium]